MSRRKISVIDSETDPFKKGRVEIKPFLWGYKSGSEYRTFTDIPELIEFLSGRHEICYAHNGGKFDFHFLLPYLSDFSELLIINGRLSKFKIGLCEFRDSVNILPIKLEDYQKTKIDYAIFEKEERYKPENWEEINNYLKDDCTYLEDLILSFIDRYGLHLTAPTAAVKTWQKMTGNKMPKSNADYYDKYALYYYGGRTQAFKMGIFKKDLTSIDINSSYPFSMLRNHPISTTSITYKNPGNFNLDQDDIGSMFFSIKALSKGALPYREGNKLTFPADEKVRTYHITGWELLAGLETNSLEILEYLKVIEYTKLISFSDYILPIYKARKEAKQSGDIKQSIFLKLLMNSLYGKFAANPRKYHTYMNIDTEFMGLLNNPVHLKKLGEKLGDGHLMDYMDISSYKFGGLLGEWCLAVKDLEEEKMNFYNIATSASVTGLSRANLWRAIYNCGVDNVHYCDTDSILTSKIGSDIKIGGDLGEWEIEGEYNYAAIAGKKLYAYREKVSGKWKTASKGVRLTPEQLIRVAEGGTVKYVSDIPSFSIRKPPTLLERNIKRVA